MPRIVYPALSFALFCALSAALGGLAGFFCVLKFGADGSPSPAANPQGESVCAFFADSGIKRQKFNPPAFRAEIEKILREDFCAKGVSSGEILPAADFEIEGGVLSVKICVNSPIALFKTIRTLAFYFCEENGRLRMKDARLGEARLPLFAAKIAFGRILGRYLEVPALGECAANFGYCRAKIEGGFLVLEK